MYVLINMLNFYKKENKMEKRISWVDYSKGIGILLVVYGHVILGLHDSNVGFQSLNYDLQHLFVYTTHMPLFFFLSGLFAANWVKRDAGLAIWQKVRTLLIPYFIWGIIQGLIMQVFSGQTNGGQGIADVLLLPIKPFAQFWFLYDLFFIFLVFYILKHVIKLSDLNIFIISFVFFLLSPMLHVWEFWRIAYHLPFFAVGTFFFSKKIDLNRFSMLQSTIVFVILNLIYFLLRGIPFLNNTFSFFVACSGIYLVVAACSHIKKANWLQFVGENSMAIYVMHIIATAGSRIILLKLGVDIVLLHVLIGMLAGVLAPLLGLFVLKKIKLDKYLL